MLLQRYCVEGRSHAGEFAIKSKFRNSDFRGAVRLTPMVSRCLVRLYASPTQSMNKSVPFEIPENPNDSAHSMKAPVSYGVPSNLQPISLEEL
jgi:hypothetical protein